MSAQETMDAASAFAKLGIWGCVLSERLDDIRSFDREDLAHHFSSHNAGNLGWFGWFTAGLVAAAAACSTVSSAAAGATDGRWLGRPYDDDGLGWERHWLGPGAMLGALDAEVAHLALDHAREGAQPAGGQQPLGNLAGDGCQRLGRRLRGGWPPGRRW
jgi:hypothetical protein